MSTPRTPRDERMMRVNLTHAIVFVSDMKRSVAFYRDVLGLPLRFETLHWTEFATEGVTLALHAAEAQAAVRDDPLRVPAGRCRPGLGVPDLNAFHRRMGAAGVTCVQPPKDVFGARIAQYLDPDGLAISVSEEKRAGTAAAAGGRRGTS
jgi:lactoylglutathione lyase